MIWQNKSFASPSILHTEAQATQSEDKKRKTHILNREMWGSFYDLRRVTYCMCQPRASCS